MVDPRLKKFLEDHLGKTASKEVLKAALLAKGWEEHIVDEAIHLVHSAKEEVIKDAKIVKRELDKHQKALWISFGVLCLLLIFLLGVKYSAFGDVYADTCMGLEDDEERNNCYLDLAKASNKTVFCEKAEPSLVDICYKEVAKNSGKKIFCNKISIPEIRDECLILAS